jgi:hypothetical protein
MPNVFQHAVGLASFAYTMTLLISYLIVMACTLTGCNLLSTVLSDKMVHVVKRIVSSCANGVFNYFALQPSCEYLNDAQDNMRQYKNKPIKSIRLYYRRVPKKLLNLYNKLTLCRLDNLYTEIMTEYTKSEHCCGNNWENTTSMSMPDYLRAHAELLPFHCGLIFEMEDGVHLMLDKTSTVTLHKMKEPHIKNAVMKDIVLKTKDAKMTLGAFLDAGKRRMKDEHWFHWDTKHNCFYITKRLLIKNGLYSEDEHEMTRYYTQMQRLYDASKTFSYSKNLEMFVQLQARTVSCNLGFVDKINRIIMYSFN